jgi:hypothetical protein
VQRSACGLGGVVARDGRGLLVAGRPIRAGRNLFAYPGRPPRTQAANRRRTPCNQPAPADTQRQQTPRSEPLSQHSSWSRDSRTCFHTAEATGSKPVTPTSTNNLLDPFCGFSCQQIASKPPIVIVSALQALTVPRVLRARLAVEEERTGGGCSEWHASGGRRGRPWRTGGVVASPRRVRSVLGGYCLVRKGRRRTVAVGRRTVTTVGRRWLIFGGCRLRGHSHRRKMSLELLDALVAFGFVS